MAKQTQPLTYSANPPPAISDRYIHSPSEWADSGDWAPTKSSNVGAIRYDKSTDTLIIQFRHGKVYGYQGNGLQFALDCFTASSIGTFVWQRIRVPNKSFVIMPAIVLITEAVLAEQEAKKTMEQAKQPSYPGKSTRESFKARLAEERRQKRR